MTVVSLPDTRSGGPRVAAIGPRDGVDLHLHTLASDGFWTPSALLDYLASHEIRVAAVCDHDSQRSVLEAQRLGGERGVTVLPGVEVTTRWADRQWHLLVYGISPDRPDPAAVPFLTILAEQEATLTALAEDAKQRLEASGRPLPSLSSIVASRPMTPFHVLSASIKEGQNKGLKDAAELVTELGGAFTADVPLERVVAAAHEAGGICVMAHPGRADSVGIMTAQDLDKMLETIPLDGLEAHYRSYTDEQTAFYRRLAAERGMLTSCGSDSHAPNMPVNPRPWQAVWCADLLDRLGVEVAPLPPGETIWAPGMDPQVIRTPVAAG